MLIIAPEWPGPKSPRWAAFCALCPRTVARRHASRCAGGPAPRGGPHGDQRALVRRAGDGPIPTQYPPVTAPDHSLHAALRDVVLPNAAVRTPRGGLADGVWQHAGLGVPPPLGAPINGCGPAGRMVRLPWATGAPGLPGNHPARGAVPGTTLLPSGPGGTGPGQLGHPSQACSPLAGPLPAGLDLVHLLGTRIPTLRRVPIAASSTCALALTCLLQALDREQTWKTLSRLLLFPRIALAAPARGGKATRSPSTQQCRLNCLAAVMDPLGDLIRRRQTAPGRGPKGGPRPRRWLLPLPKPPIGQQRPSEPFWPNGRREGPSNS